MASAQNPVKLSSEIKQTMYYYDPADARDEAFLTWVDMRDFDKFLASIMLTVGTGILTVKLYCSGSSTGADTPVIIRSHAAPDVADAIGDTVIIECNAEEIAALATATCVHPRYVAVKLDMDAQTDTVAYTYTLAGGKNKADITADVISA